MSNVGLVAEGVKINCHLLRIATGRVVADRKQHFALWRLLPNSARFGRRFFFRVMALPSAIWPGLTAKSATMEGKAAAGAEGVSTALRPAANRLLPVKARAGIPVATALQGSLRSTASLGGGEILLTVSGTIPESIASDVAQQRRPRADYLELSRRLKADLLDYAKARSLTGAAGGWLETIAGSNVMLAYGCWLVRDRYRAIITDGEQVGLPLASLLKFSRGRRPRHIMITHVISAAKKTLLLDVLGLVSQIDTFVVYSSSQLEYLRRRWPMAEDQLALIPFMVDEEFFNPEKLVPMPVPRSRICAVGLERRDYPTLLKAVDGLDVDVVIAAASPWSKRKQDLGSPDIPSNVTVKKFTQFELRQLLADCEFSVMPLQPVDFQAGITAILEAMAMGKAVVCSEIPGQTDAIVNGETGRYVPAGDAAALRVEIMRLLSERDEIARLGANARKAVVQEFGLNRYTERLSAIVDAALNRAATADGLAILH